MGNANTEPNIINLSRHTDKSCQRKFQKVVSIYTMGEESENKLQVISLMHGIHFRCKKKMLSQHSALYFMIPIQ